MADNDTWGARGRGVYYAKMGEALGSALADLGLTHKRVAFDNLETGISIAAAFPQMTAIGGEALFRHVRARKTPQEVQLLKKATWINQTALERSVREWQKGMSWHDLLFCYQVHALSLGGAPNLPDTNAPGNERGTYFAADMEVADYELCEGMNIMFDLHGRYNSYCWDGGKSWVIGGAPHQGILKNWNATVTATQEMANASRTGEKISALSAIGFDTFRKLGYNEKGIIIFFDGLGLDHIDQDLSHGNKDWVLQRDMVYSIHVAFPGDEGERLFLEEILLIKDDSAERIFTWDEKLLASGRT
jgi:Xaa-Pro aminopeptidase